MKHVLAIGDVTDGAASRTVATSPPKSPKSLLASNDTLAPATPKSAPRKAAGPAVWVPQADGSWAIRWRVTDTWWDLSARYLQAGKRWRELFQFQTDAFHARVPEPIAIYTGALVTMPSEAVDRAAALGELPGTGAAGGARAGTGASSSSSQATGQGTGPTAPSGSSSTSSGGRVTPIRPQPIVRPLPTTPTQAGTSHESGVTAHWWILGTLGVLGLGAIGLAIHHAHKTQGERA